MPETKAPETVQADTIPEAALHAAMDAFYPSENWRVDLGFALPTSLYDMAQAISAADRARSETEVRAALATPTGGGTDTREALKSKIAELRGMIGKPNVDLSYTHNDMCRFAAEMLGEVAALARPAAPAVDVPAERERITRVVERVLCDHGPGLGIGVGVFEKVADAILATRPTDPGGARGWQDISSAPKGKEIPCLAPEYNKGPVMLSFYYYNGLHAWRDMEQDIYNPTQWFDLPEPPAASTASSEAGGQS